jgi:hypothetical protein
MPGITAAASSAVVKGVRGGSFDGSPAAGAAASGCGAFLAGVRANGEPNEATIMATAAHVQTMERRMQCISNPALRTR